MALERKNNCRYELLLNWQITEICNLNCRHCFRFTSTRFRDYLSTVEMFVHTTISSIKKIMLCSRDKAEFYRPCVSDNIRRSKVSPINIAALIAVLDRSGKVCQVSFSGGEPFLVPNIIDACVAITQRHFIGFSTNLVSGDIKRFAKTIDPAKVIGILASLHLKELERSGILKIYIENFLFCRQRGIDIRATQVAYPALSQEVDKYKFFFKKEGIIISFSPFRGYFKGRRYPESYSEEELRIFGLDDSCRFLLYTQGRICNAGVNVAVIAPSGVIYPCFNIKEEIGSIYSELKLKEAMTVCPVSLCKCPFFDYEKQLYENALTETSGYRYSVT